MKRLLNSLIAMCVVILFVLVAFINWQESEARRFHNEVEQFCVLWAGYEGTETDCSIWADQKLELYQDAIEWCFDQAPIETMQTYTCVVGVVGNG